MISMHEPVQRKARFWQSYVRALKGTEDMRAESGAVSKRRQRPFSEIPDLFPRLYEDLNEDASSRVNAPGYRYQPVSRETYGRSPRLISAELRPSRFLASRH